jgi:hypothetical protein
MFRVGDVLEKKHVPISKLFSAAKSAIHLVIAHFPA